MNRNIFHYGLRGFLLSLVFLLLGSSLAQAQPPITYRMCAGEFTKTMPDGVTTVQMWGYALDTNTTFADDCGTAEYQSPGPVLTIPPGTNRLRVRLHNALPPGSGSELRNVSISIPAVGPPNGSIGDVETSSGRVTSFVGSVAIDGTRTYNFGNNTGRAITPGTYLYHSGTHPAVQMQMGLYGAATKSFAIGSPAQAYECPATDAACSDFDNEALLVYSEIDPDLHAAVVAGDYGTPGLTSTIDYQPKYFLINGNPYPDSLPILASPLSSGQQVLVRLVNAGLRAHAPTVQGLALTQIAEDGNLAPLAAEQSSVRLNAGKTVDALVTLPTAPAATYMVYDRLLDVTNAGHPDGGMIVALEVGGGAPPPTLFAVDDAFQTNEDTASVALDLLGNDSASATSAVNISSPANGTFAPGTGVYTPNANFTGVDSFTYQASDGSGESNVATVRIDVTAMSDDAPVAVADGPIYVMVGQEATGNVLGNDYDGDGDALTASLISGSATVMPDGTFTLTPSCTPGPSLSCEETFTYEATDGTFSSNIVAVTVVARGSAGGPCVVAASPSGASPSSFKWTLEEDLGYHGTPGVPDDGTLALSFHRSYMPVVAAGESPTCLPTLDPLKHYFVSVLPSEGYSNGGTSIPAGHSGSVDVIVQTHPVPTAQITVFAFEDNAPLNGAPDYQNEDGLAGFQVILEDAGGRYGVSGGHMTMDAYGNPLGTTYDGAGNVVSLGSTLLLTGPDGTLTISNLPPGKYGVSLVPPVNDKGWSQTSTIEGKKVIDAWVKGNEPPFFSEFGPPGPHVFIGFVKETNNLEAGGSANITGEIVNLHTARPPNVGFSGGIPLGHTTAWVGLNDSAGTGQMLYAARTNDGMFTIPNVPSGSYQLVVWDDYLDTIIAYHGVTVDGAGCVNAAGPVSCDYGKVPVFSWFSRLENNVFEDIDEDGFWDAGEPAGDLSNVLIEQAVNLRFRDGTVYQSFPTDLEGFVPFDEVFPFFSWIVAEIDFARHKATGVTVVVDAGGEPGDPTDPWSFGGVVNPQPQPDNGGEPFRTETGAVLTQAFQGFIGHTNVIQWGKADYAPGENGGISGIVFYAITRAENDPRLAAGEEWEPGIAEVTVRLYDETGTLLLAEAATDSWDANLPTGCVGDVFLGPVDDTPTDCFDGLRNYNQVRPGLFDGGYAFTDICAAGLESDGSCSAVEVTMPAGDYIVEIVAPPGYELLREESNNVGFGDDFGPNASGLQLEVVEPYLDEFLPFAAGPILAAQCVGALHTVDAELELFPGEGAPWAGQQRPLCDRKAVRLDDQQNAAADFWLYTQAPIAAHVVGFVLNDLANEFDAQSPQFGEKLAPKWVPIAFRDWTGTEIHRTYSDEWGRYSAMLPSTYTAYIPNPSGMSPSMMTACMNDPGSPGNPDPFYKPEYSQFCYTFQYMPGATTYLDTPVVPTGAFTSTDQFPVDCELPDGTPRIQRVDGPDGGPWVINRNTSFTIDSQGMVEGPNPAYCPGPPLVAAGLCDGMMDANKTITRNYGFGGTMGTVTIDGQPITDIAWTDGSIMVNTMPPGVGRGGQLLVTKADSEGGQTTVTGIHMTVRRVRGELPNRVAVGESIQDVIDAPSTRRGELILVECGEYEEMVVLTKAVLLQGYGEGCTMINAVNAPAEKLDALRQHLLDLEDANVYDLLPGQELENVTFDQGAFQLQEGAGVLVVGRARGNGLARFGGGRIDGFQITGATNQGIIVNGYTQGFKISNNRVRGNQGFFGGGIRVGHTQLTSEDDDGIFHVDAQNNGIEIVHNQITQNGGLGGVGGGVAVCTGADGYAITGNWICGNFTQGDGAGIGHLGVSNNGRIEDNQIVFNQSFNQGQKRDGGGIFIGGHLPFEDALSPGSGSVRINANLIQGNHAGAGDGAGIAAVRVNGQDVARRRNNQRRWYRLDVFNNIVVKNVAGEAGGGISLLDVARSRIQHNTVANNDSTATAMGAFPPGSFVNPGTGTIFLSDFQPAGIASRGHSQGLADAIGNVPTRFELGFSNPALQNNIVHSNRAARFTIDSDGTTTIGTLGAWDITGAYDLGVIGAPNPAALLNPRFSLLTSVGPYHVTNVMGDPMFLGGGLQFNGERNAFVTNEPTTSLPTAVAFDEGGNFIDVKYGNLFIGLSNFHIGPTSPAIGIGSGGVDGGLKRFDIDDDPRPSPSGSNPDAGADEAVATGVAPPPTGGN